MSLLEEFGVRLVTYDLPGFGESDPHPNRTLQSSALDLLHLVESLNIDNKFWVLGYSSGAMHAWAALKYIPGRIAGKITFSTSKMLPLLVMKCYYFCSNQLSLCS